MEKRKVVKICGLKDPSVVEGLEEIDFLGYVVGSPKSFRNLDLEKVIGNELIIRDKRSVLVTVSSRILELVKDRDLDLKIQLHGAARTQFIEEQLEEIKTTSCIHPLIQKCRCFEESDIPERVDKELIEKIALGISATEFFGRNDSSLKQFLKPLLWNKETNFLYLTIDTTRRDGYGGTGNSWEWREIPEISQTVLIAGGINPNNVSKALLTTKADGIDVSSGVERSRVKDRSLIQKLVQNIS